MLLLEMFLTTAHAAQPDSPTPNPDPATPSTSPEGQVPSDLAEKPSPAPASATPDPAPTPPPAPEKPSTKRAPPDPDVPAAPPRLGPGGELRVHGALHNAAVGASLAFDWAFRRASLGVGVDYAAWIDPTSLRVSPGALHVFALVMHRVPLGRVALRQRIGVGPAIALMAIGERKAGSTGLFFEAAPLGLEVQTRVKRLAVTLDAFSMAISAPIVGENFYAKIQYRLALGLRF